MRQVNISQNVTYDRGKKDSIIRRLSVLKVLIRLLKMPVENSTKSERILDGKEREACRQQCDCCRGAKFATLKYVYLA